MQNWAKIEDVSKKESWAQTIFGCLFWIHAEAQRCGKRFPGITGWCTEHQITSMLPSSRSNSFAALSEEQNGAQPDGSAKARKRKTRKLSHRRSTSDAAQVAEPPQLSRLSMGPTGTDGGLRNGEKCIQKLTDSHCIEHWCCQTPGAVQSCGMSGVCGLYPLVSQRPRGRGSSLCQYASLSSAWHGIAVQAAMNLIVPAEGDAQGRPPPRPNSDVGAAAEVAADASSRPGSGSNGAAGPPASGPPKQRSPQRLAAGHPAGVSALISEAHRAVVTVVLQACCVPHALLSVPSQEAVQSYRD